MRLDFQTLYVIILLNSLCYCVVWGGFAYVHRDISASRYWLGAAVLSTLGGLLMSGDGPGIGRVFMIAGNTVVVAAFVLVWQGIRTFYGCAPLWRAGAFMVVLAVVAGVAADDTRASQNIAYAGSQLVPLIMATIVLWRWGRRSLGAYVAEAGLLIAIAGQGTEAGLNTLRIFGQLSTDNYYKVASLLLVAVMMGAALWWLGFLLMAVDRLRSELKRLASSDHLTGLPNRRHFMESAQEALRNAVATGRNIAVLLIDIDHFKGINDARGHAAGDACLRHFATLSGRMGHARTLLARFGGDEFALLMDDADASDAVQMADQMVRTLANTPLNWRGQSLTITLSIGIATCTAGAVEDVDALIEAADMALYETKGRGRNGFTLGRNTCPA